MLKRLQRYRYDAAQGRSKVIGVVTFDEEMFNIFKKKYQIKCQNNQTVIYFNGKIITRVDFNDTDMEKIFKKINQIS